MQFWRHLSRILPLAIVALTTSGLSAAEPKSAQPIVSRLSTVFELGDGRQTQYGYRIPAMVVTPSDTICAFCERRTGLHDHAENDIVLRRSVDGGVTWGPMQIIAEEGGDSLNDPCAIVLDTGRLLLRYTRFPKGVHARNSKHTVIAEPGYDGPKNVRLYLTHSDDNGATWSTPRDVTRDMRRERAISVGSPGVGLQLMRGTHAGRVVFPNYEVFDLGGGRPGSANSASFSDDGGTTWKLSEDVAEPETGGYGNEAQLVELADDGIFLSARDESGGTHRKVSFSRDGGQTWSQHRIASDLLTPQCMSSVIRYSWPDGQQPGLLLHSLPHTKDSRTNGTLMISRDEGKTWKPGIVVEPKSFAYSCLARLRSGDVGCLYETDEYHRIVYSRVAEQAFTGANGD